MLAPRSKRYILWFKEISKKDTPHVGGKTANLGEMYNQLSEKGVPVPNGFAITAQAYRYFINETGIAPKINALLKQLNTKDLKNLQRTGKALRKIIENTRLPPKLRTEIIEAYKKLSTLYKMDDADVAVRSSATAEDLPGASFAGQQETFLNVSTERVLLLSVRKCFASLFTDRAISYREDKGFKHSEVYISVAVQKMIRSDKASSGVMFTIDTESGFKDVVFINASYGLGEYIVKGVVTPDEFYVHKPTLQQGYKSIVSRKLGNKKKKLIYSTYGTRNSPVSKDDQRKFAITDVEACKLAEFAITIENHYKTPMDIEWAKDAREDKLYVLQARPETVHAINKSTIYEVYDLKVHNKPIATGLAVGQKIGKGEANIIHTPKEIHDFKEGQVLVTDMTDPDWEPIMKIAAAIVTNKGGRTCHAAIISRELGIPCIVGTKDATKKIKQGQSVTVSCAEGEVGYIYAGKIPFEVHHVNLRKTPKTRTDVMINAGLPELAFKLGQLPCDGVGLAREEFIITEHIKIHPLALLNYEELKHKKQDPLTQQELKQIDELTKEYPSSKKAQFFVDKLASGITTIAAAFYPRTVIVRLSDLKSNEYANLLGGKLFEPHEQNPMLGWRGASRYYSKTYRPAFELECKAIKRVREKLGFINVKVMLPFCRTLDEAKKVLAIMKENGLASKRFDLEIYMMLEIPSDIILLEDFCKLFDGFSIGSNDLTQLVLGVDRDSELVAPVFDERNPAVLHMLASAIKTAKRHNKKIGICGDAPSTYRKFTKFLVEHKIDSISVSPDVFLKTKLQIARLENN